MGMKFSEAAELLGRKARPDEEELVITGYSTDTRTIRAGDMFIAIKGGNFNGADFINKALEKGASSIVTALAIEGRGIINAGDPVAALGKLAAYNRRKFNIPVIAVTGSTGKTSVKNMLVSVLSQKFNVHHTEGNLNNHIGLPMTLLEMNDSHEISVIEMGMSALGEIDYLASITSPSAAIITNIGTAHIGMLGSRENIFRAKTEVASHIREGGDIIINGDDEFLAGFVPKNGCRVISYGMLGNNDIMAEDIIRDKEGTYLFRSDKTIFRLNIPGKHNIFNALAAIAAGRLFGVPEEFIQKGIAESTIGKMRLDIYETEGVRFINDAYNANPQSMEAALDILSIYEGRRIAVLGDMLEMGEFSKDAHEKLGSMAAACSDVLLFCGEEAGFVRTGAEKAGMDGCSIHIFKDSDEAGALLKSILRPGDTVLVKGSRGMKMENVLKYTGDGVR
ncbi:MAG: UDP-N-acetylmuramoyl-tripeptide--D-alanyl-D-alanine ligase [Clostridia bacterium]|nr:UDP-N-acetylmuramoyl-tripeptide--D-alanyl-D-alanine ligase [Clostridia bacterium]